MSRNLKAALVAVGVITVFGASASVSFAEAGSVGNSSKTVIVGNKICPVTGEKISKKTEVTYTYKGKVYSFCCRECIDEFKKNPEKFISKIKEEKAGKVK